MWLSMSQYSDVLLCQWMAEQRMGRIIKRNIAQRYKGLEVVKGHDHSHPKDTTL